MKNKIEQVAQQVHTDWNPEFGGWPDCYKISKKIQERVELECSDCSAEVIECFPCSGYRHYVVEVTAPNKSVLVDASFEQFDAQADTPVTVGRDVPSVVVVSPPEKYVFY